MTKGRLEAFSDGVLAVIITIMVLELKPPHGADLHGVIELGPKFTAYVLSFIYIGIYWNNHHHLMHTVKRVTGRVLWANLHLLFWLSLVPLCTAWVGEHHDEPLPTAAYGVSLLASAVAWVILQRTIADAGNPIDKVIGPALKEKISPILYLAGIGLSWVKPVLGDACYLIVALMWVIPDRRIEDNKELNDAET